MKKVRISFLLLCMFFSFGILQAQELPNFLTSAEKNSLKNYSPSEGRENSVNPPDVAVRTAAEWEEMQGVIISWQNYGSVLKEIVRNAVQEGKVYIVSQSQSSVTSTLTGSGISMDSVVFVDAPSNSVWIRDYGANNIYTVENDDLRFVDWTYNRPRPADDVVPEALADLMNITLYQTTQAPNKLVNTGGNFMTDGFGTGFASNLVVDENPSLSTAQIDEILNKYMGINRYIKMSNLPYDGIHHIDMHMKLLDEETILVGQYPDGVADGPQIELNLQYVLDNFNSKFGTPFRVIRIPMPADASGNYPNNYGDYRTYTNSLILNKTILVPIYGAAQDNEALQIYKDAMPGYKVVGIDCNQPIAASGAIHCITHEIASPNPLLISHQRSRDITKAVKKQPVSAYIKHRSGIEKASIYYTTDLANPFVEKEMVKSTTEENIWTDSIPVADDATKIYYYIKAKSVSGKEQVRPITAPSGYWSFSVISSENYVANAGSDQTVEAIDLVQLNGSASTAPNSNIVYQWKSLSDITLSENTIVNPTFTAPRTDENQDYEFTLKVGNGSGTWSALDTVKITVNGDKLPIANAGEDQNAEDFICQLDGSASHDPENKSLTYEWSCKEEYLNELISDRTIVNPIFKIPTPIKGYEEFIITLKVNDGKFNSKLDTVIIGADIQYSTEDLKNELNIKINPNPSDGKFTIELPEKSNLDIRIFTIDGKMVFQEKTPKNIFIKRYGVDISHCKSGTYILLVSDGKRKSTRKLIKQ